VEKIVEAATSIAAQYAVGAACYDRLGKRVGEVLRA
jgi:hypothetical protein